METPVAGHPSIRRLLIDGENERHVELSENFARGDGRRRPGEFVMGNDYALRRLARESIAKGLLPDRSPEQTWGGPGTGAKCALCEALVRSDELEFEVEFGRDRFHLHLACFSAWDAERKAGFAESATPASVGARFPSRCPLSASSDKHRVLPDPEGDGKMLGNGGARAYKRGAA